MADWALILGLLLIGLLFIGVSVLSVGGFGGKRNQKGENHATSRHPLGELRNGE